jgi:hypothetical protein
MGVTSPGVLATAAAAPRSSRSTRSGSTRRVDAPRTRWAATMPHQIVAVAPPPTSSRRPIRSCRNRSPRSRPAHGGGSDRRHAWPPGGCEVA